MKISVNLTVSGEIVKTDVIDIDDEKLELLTEDEVEAAIEVHIRTWAERHVQIAWEALEADASSEHAEDVDEDS